MNYDVFKCSVVGYKNILKKGKSQDYIDYKIYNEGVICTVADGHSTSYFEYSDKGSELACKAGIEVLEKYINKDKDYLENELNEFHIQKKVYERWLELVNEHFKSINPVVFKTQYIKYSTTLICVLATDKFILFLNIGDGNIVIKNKDKYKKLIKNDNVHIVNSFGRNNAYINLNYRLEDIENYKNTNIILFTDGFEDSFKNDIELYQSLDKTVNKYSKNVFSRFILKKYYEKYLSNLSKDNSLDDISIIFLKLLN